MKRLKSIVVPSRILRVEKRLVLNRRHLLTGTTALTMAAMLPAISSCSDDPEIMGFLKIVAKQLLVSLADALEGSSEFQNKGDSPQKVQMALTVLDESNTDQDQGLVQETIPATGELYTVLWGGLSVPKEGVYHTQGRALGLTRETEKVTVTA